MSSDLLTFGFIYLIVLSYLSWLMYENDKEMKKLYGSNYNPVQTARKKLYVVLWPLTVVCFILFCVFSLIKGALVSIKWFLFRN